MKSPVRSIAIAAILFVGDPRTALAGMPSVTLTDIAQMRLEAISFFLLCFLACSWLVQRIWNSARMDFPRLPYLSFRRATGLVAIWGLLFLLILTMISGARELMTPGAWHKVGFTYKLADDEPATKAAAVQQETERRHALDRLRAALWTYARDHAGKFPPTSSPAEIPEDVWLLPGNSGMRHLYVPGLVADQGANLLVFEPEIFGRERFALFSNGEIRPMSEEGFREALAERSPR
jgi:hypothetical protein